MRNSKGLMTDRRLWQDGIWIAYPSANVVNGQYVEGKMSNGSFRDTHEIEEYRVQVNGSTDIIFTRFIDLKLKALFHGLEPDVTLSFVPNFNPAPGTIHKNSIFDAQFVIPLKEQDFSDIYAVLQSEKPVYFTYTAASNWTDPANQAATIDITQISIHTDLELVGENEPVSTLRTVQLRNALTSLQSRIRRTR